MSLITEALKRAQKTTDEQSAGQTPQLMTPPPLLGNQHVEMPQDGNRRPQLASPVVLVLIAVLVVVAGGIAARIWFSGRAVASKQMPVSDQAKATRERTTEIAQPKASTVVKEPVPASKSAEATPPKNAEVALGTPIPEKAKTEQITPPAPPLPPREPPKLTLQGIMSEGQDREAVISGISVRVGEIVEGAKVLAIDSKTVRLDFQGSEIVLRLP